MPTHVYANNNEIASKACAGKSIAAFPDVCFSPPAPPVGPMPLPYPNTGEATNTDKGTSKVFIKDKMSGIEGDSYFSKSMGDESATQNFTKGMITSALQGKCYFGVWSMNVQMEGKGVPRHLDMVTHNHASMMGQISAVNVDNMDMAKTVEGVEIEEKQEEEKETKNKIHVPIIFLPGFMGSVLVDKNKPSTKIWSINNVRAILGIIGFVLGKRSTIMRRVVKHFSEGSVIAFREDFKNSSYVGKDKCKFNIKSTLKLLYGPSLRKMRKLLNNLASDKDRKVKRAKNKISESIMHFSTVNPGGDQFDMSAISGKIDDLKQYKFDVWGGGYNWTGSSANSAKEIYYDLIPSIQKFYVKNELKYLGHEGKSIKVFIVTHSMGGYVGQEMEFLDVGIEKIQKVIYGGIPMQGAQAFYYTALAGLKYLIPFLPKGIMRRVISAIFINSQGCLELLPNDYCGEIIGEKIEGRKFSKFTPSFSINNWLHVKNKTETIASDPNSPYEIYKSKGLCGIYPEKFHNQVTKKRTFGPIKYNKLIFNIDKARAFHLIRNFEANLKSADTSKSVYLWGNNLDVGKSFGEIAIINEGKEKLHSVAHHPGDGTVANSTWLADAKYLNAVTYSKKQLDMNDEEYDYTFSHMGMFSESDVRNFVAHQICEKLLSGK